MYDIDRLRRQGDEAAAAAGRQAVHGEIRGYWWQLVAEVEGQTADPFVVMPVVETEATT